MRTDKYNRTWMDSDLKKCCRCKLLLQCIYFGGITKINDYCIECKRVVESDARKKDPDTRRKQNREAAARRYAKNCLLLDEYLVGKSCVDCGESDPVVLDFDHIDQKTKTHQIGDMLGDCNWNTILLEIEKCEIRCANDHRRRTAIQLGWRVKGGGAK